MMIKDAPRNLTEPKILKVRLPTNLHLSLHRLKLLTGKSISQTVAEALEVYMVDRYPNRAAAHAEAAEHADAAGRQGQPE